MKIYSFVIILAIICFPTFLWAQEKPSATYVSKTMQLAPYNPYKHNYTVGELVKCNWMTFTFFKSYINVTIKETDLKLKILNVKMFNDGLRYGVVDNNHLNYQIIVELNDRKKQTFGGRILFVEYAKDNTPISIKYIQCKKS